MPLNVMLKSSISDHRIEENLTFLSLQGARAISFAKEAEKNGSQGRKRFPNIFFQLNEAALIEPMHLVLFHENEKPRI